MSKMWDNSRCTTGLWLLVVCSFSRMVVAGSPAWTPPSGVRTTMTVHAVVRKADGKLLTAPGSLLAAFKGDEIRGVATSFQGENDVAQFQLAIGSNEAIENDLSLRFYDPAADAVFETKQILDFVSDTTLGTIGKPIEFSGGSQLSKPWSEKRAGDPAGASSARWAFRLASAIPSVPHLHDRSTCQYEALSRYLALGMVDEAIEESEQIENWRRGVLFTDLAAVYARREGPGLMMRHFLDLAASYRDSVTGMNAGWQKERISAYIALALAKAGLFAEAKQAAKDIQDSAVSQLAVEECGAIRDDAELKSVLATLATMAKSIHFEHKQSAARGYIRILTDKNSLLDQPDRDAILEALEAIPERLPAALQCEIQGAVARAAYEVGARNTGLRMLQAGMRGISARGAHADIDVRNYVDLALVYSECEGNSEMTDLLIHKAASLLQDGKFTRSERVEAILALAAGQWRLGHQDAAADLFGKALAVARTQVNGRPRFKMLVALCLRISECGAELPETIREALSEEYDHQGDPW